MLRAATESLAARAGVRQVELVVRADAAQRACDAVAARARSALRAALRARDPHAVARVLRALPAALSAALSARLAALALWSRRSAVRSVGAEVPRRALLWLLARRHARRTPHPRPASRMESVWPWEDLLGAARALSLADLLKILFPPPPREEVEAIVFASGWRERIRSGTGLGDPEAVARQVAAGFAAGEAVGAIERRVLPEVDRVASTARRVARTESMRVAAAVQMDCHRQLGDLVVGYQVHATLDERTRPEHRARDGTIYYAEPKAGQPGYDQMPHPPQEADGSTAWNCRCWLSPVLREPGQDEGAARLTPPPAPEQLVYSDWFAGADERRRRLAVGSARYDAARKAAGGEVGWEHFLDVDTGRLISASALAGEGAQDRAARLARTREVLAARRAAKARVLGYGFT